jgi:hypothetical protein
MRIYFSGAISGGRENLPVYQHIVARLKVLGHEVPSEHVASTRVLEEEAPVPPRAVYERDIGWICACDAMIAEVSTPSLGVGYEVARALQKGKNVLCVYREGLFISKMVTGNPSPHLCLGAYRDTGELDHQIDRFLAGLRSS